MEFNFKLARKLFLKDANCALEKIVKHYKINGFAVFFEDGQDAPCFEYAINTESNGSADPSTGEWDFPAGGFIGSEMGADWGAEYAIIEDWMSGGGSVNDVKKIFVECMIQLKKDWTHRLPNCIFTVNYVDDDSKTVLDTYQEINGS